MTTTRQWYYDGVAIGGATGKTHALTAGQTNSRLIECRSEITFGAEAVAALARYEAGGPLDDFEGRTENLAASSNWENIRSAAAGGSTVGSGELSFPTLGGDVDGATCLWNPGGHSGFNAGSFVEIIYNGGAVDNDYFGVVLFLRYDDDNNYVYSRVGVGSSNSGANLSSDLEISITEVIGGTPTDIRSNASIGDYSSTATPVAVRMEADDATDNVDILIGGSSVITPVATSKTTGGKTGVGTSGLRHALIGSFDAGNL